MRRAISLGALQPEPPQRAYMTVGEAESYLFMVAAADKLRTAFEHMAISSAAAIPAFQKLAEAMSKMEHDAIVNGRMIDGH